MKYYLGILGLSKKSYAILADDKGEIIAYISTLPLALRIHSNIREYLEITIDNLCQSINKNKNDVIRNLSGACFSMSGIYSENYREEFRQILNRIGIIGDYKIVITENINAFFASRLLYNGGAVLRIGTGTVVSVHINQPKLDVRVNGWGSVISDEGSGYYLGLECIKSLFKSEDGRMEKSEILLTKVLEFIGLSSDTHGIKDLVEWYYYLNSTINWRSEISDLAIPLIEAAEKDNDEFSKKIILRGANEIIESIKAAENRVLRKNNIDEINNIPIIIDGGVFDNSFIYSDKIIKFLETESLLKNKWEVIKLELFPSVGTIILATAGMEYIETPTQIVSDIVSSAKKQKLYFN